MYDQDLPPCFTAWNDFYDELIAKGLIIPGEDFVNYSYVNLNLPLHVHGAEPIRVKQYTFQRSHIERKCLSELRQKRKKENESQLSEDELVVLVNFLRHVTPFPGLNPTIVKLIAQHREMYERRRLSRDQQITLKWNR